MECGTTSLEGEISRAIAYLGVGLAILATTWHCAFEFFGKAESVSSELWIARAVYWLDRNLETFFDSLARQWQSLGLLFLAFALATVVPIFNLATHDPAIMKILRGSEPLSWLPGTARDTFQCGVWLLIGFVVAVVFELMIKRAKTRETRGRVYLAATFMSALLWIGSQVQDYVGR